MKIAVEGCAHGDLETIYDSLRLLEQKQNVKVDLLLCCGDFQAVRNEHDLCCMAVPPKYREICSFYKYYSGEKVAPVLTIFVGGNHEASNHLQELPYGGWVAPKIYYMGYAGVVNVAGVRIGGISGIYKGFDFMMGHHEKPPYNDNTKRSVYHVRNIEVFRLKQIKSQIDIFMSHDWPLGIHNYGNVEELLRVKPFFREDIEADRLGSPPCQELLLALKPTYWFSAHLHCKFAAVVPHENGCKKKTKFLALDKCLPRRKFLQVLEVVHDKEKDIELEYDLEWLTVLHFTNHLTCLKREMVILPQKEISEEIRWDFTPTDVEKEFVFEKMSRDLKVPDNFVKTVMPHSPGSPAGPPEGPAPSPQTQTFCSAVGVTDIFEKVLGTEGRRMSNPRMDMTQSPRPDSTLSPRQDPLSSFVDSDDPESDTESDCSTPLKRRGLLEWESDEAVTTPPPRPSLSLPPPRVSLSSPASPPSERDDSPASSTPQTDKPSIDQSDQDSGLFCIDVEPSQPTPPVSHKKFKRRNQDIYKDSEDTQ